LVNNLPLKRPGFGLVFFLWAKIEDRALQPGEPQNLWAGPQKEKEIKLGKDFFV
jgi:hypothetical protein